MPVRSQTFRPSFERALEAGGRRGSNAAGVENSPIILGEAGKLLFAKFAGRHERSGRQRRRERDQCDGATAAYERKRAACRTIIATHVVAPILGRPAARLRYIGVMIARDYGDVRRRPDVVEPRARPRVFDQMCIRDSAGSDRAPPA